MHPCITLYNISKSNVVYCNEPGICRITGQQSTGLKFDKWVRKTFNDYAYLKPGNIISNEAIFCFDEGSVTLAKKIGKYYMSIKDLYAGEAKKVENWQKKKKTPGFPAPEEIGYKLHGDGVYVCPQRFRTYSHIIHNGTWYCLTKADKPQIFKLITSGAELVSLNDTGQKHVYFKHKPGFWQLDELYIAPDIDTLKYIHTVMCDMLRLGFSQAEVITGEYKMNRINITGLDKWQELESEIKLYRGSGLFKFASWMLFISEQDKQNIQNMYEQAKQQAKLKKQQQNLNKNNEPKGQTTLW